MIIVVQMATWYHSTTLSVRLEDNIANLRHTEAELRALLDDLPDSVIVLDGDGRIVEANKLAMEITGRQHAEVLNKTLHVARAAGRPADLVDVWGKLRDGEDVSSPVFPFDHPDGHEILLEADVHVPIRDPERVVVTLRDVTARLREAHDLDLAQERFRLAFHGAPTGMALSTGRQRHPHRCQRVAGDDARLHARRADRPRHAVDHPPRRLGAWRDAHAGDRRRLRTTWSSATSATTRA